jgi:hypothetical protein
VQRTDLVAARDRGVRLRGAGERAFAVDLHDGVDRTAHVLDAAQMRRDDLAAEASRSRTRAASASAGRPVRSEVLSP